MDGNYIGNIFYFRLFTISRMVKLEYLDDRIVDKDERTEAIRMYGNKKKMKPNSRHQSELERFRGIMLNDFSNPSSSTSSHTALEAAETIEDTNEDFPSISEQDSSSTETIYYSFEEHIQFLAQKFSEKFNEWKESFHLPRRNT